VHGVLGEAWLFNIGVSLRVRESVSLALAVGEGLQLFDATMQIRNSSAEVPNLKSFWHETLDPDENQI
jgi:hypothetical protein